MRAGRAQEMIDDMNHRTGANAIIAEFQYGFDRMSHRLFEKRVHDGNLGDVYRYDSIYRVIRVSQDVDLISIRPKEPEDQRLVLTREQQQNVAILALLLIPGLFIVLGIREWWSRR